MLGSALPHAHERAHMPMIMSAYRDKSESAYKGYWGHVQMRAGRARRQLGGSPLTRADSRTLEVKTAIAGDSLYTCLLYRGILLITELILSRTRCLNSPILAFAVYKASIFWFIHWATHPKQKRLLINWHFWSCSCIALFRNIGWILVRG